MHGNEAYSDVNSNTDELDTSVHRQPRNLSPIREAKSAACELRVVFFASAVPKCSLVLCSYPFVEVTRNILCVCFHTFVARRLALLCFIHILRTFSRCMEGVIFITRDCVHLMVGTRLFHSCGDRVDTWFVVCSPSGCSAAARTLDRLINPCTVTDNQQPRRPRSVRAGTTSRGNSQSLYRPYARVASS